MILGDALRPREMTQRRLLALLALLLGLVAGLLLLLTILHIPRDVTLNWIIEEAVLAIIGLIIIVAGLIIYGGNYLIGGILCVVLGLLVLIYWQKIDVGLLSLLAGILAIIAEES